MRLFERSFGEPDTLGPVRNRLIQRFLREEDGTITAFSLIIFVLMVAVAGIAIDIMRYETQRVQLQYTLDRAVIAAASTAQPLDPIAVVENYFEISGLNPDRYRLNVNFDEGINWRRVDAYAEMEINTFFMHMFGVRVLTSPAEGAAEELIQNVEVSLVLDISGSMGSQNRNTNMRAAATEFVTTMLEANTTELGELVSISVIPYNGKVNVGSTIASVFNLSGEHTESNCTRFTAEQFSRTSLSPTEEIERLAHFDRRNFGSNQLFSSPHCQTDEYGAILPFEHDETVLHNYINSLGAGGWTAIDLGTKWAVALLDPAARPAIDTLVANGTLHPDFAGRPADFLDRETVKVVVVMTDGANTDQYDVRQPYKRGPSPIYYHAGDNRYSVYMASRDDSQDFWISNGAPNVANGYWAAEPYLGNESQALSWPYLWANYTGEYVTERFLRVPANQAGDNTLVNALNGSRGRERYAGQSAADTNLRTICDAANAVDRRISIFTIAFEAPPGGQAVMQYCATSEAHYYNVNGLQISDAFSSIANAINQLRLIQ